MTDARDFAAFPSTDQAYPQTRSGPAGDRYDAERGTNASQTAAEDSSVRYSTFGAQQAVHSPSTGQFNYNGFGTPGPLVWDWNSSLEFSDFANTYEPQGELVQELQTQSASTNDFTIPLPISNVGAIKHSPQQIPGAISTSAQNPLSPPPRPQQRPALQTGMKRKAESEPNSAVSQTVSLSDTAPPTKRPTKSRSSSTTSVTSPVIATQPNHSNAPRRTSMTQITINSGGSELATAATTAPGNEAQRKKEISKGTGPQGRVIDVSKPRKVVESPSGAEILPAGKVFPIQIGSELFRLSGASISSDAPSYFSHFFGEQLHANSGRAGDLRTLYIDRDPETFREIALHLQGYHIVPRDGEHFVRLFADAQFYSLPRLTKQLFNTDIFIRIGGTPFQVPRDLFSAPGDSPNYFSLGFAQFFSTPSEVFPGLDRSSLLRPPSISPPAVPNKSGETFAELVMLLQGYPLDIKNDVHRQRLLKDARYFHLKGLEQRLIACQISYNLKRRQSEILIKLEDIRQSGIAFSPDASDASSTGSGSNAPSALGISPTPTSKPSSPAPGFPGSPFKPGTVTYARPYTDDQALANILILELSTSETTTLHFPAYPPTPTSSTSPTLNLRATFHGNTLARITALFGVIASKMGLPATQPLGLMMLQSGGGVAAQPVSPANSGVSESRVRVRLDPDCYIELDNTAVELGVDKETGRVGMKRVSASRRMVNGDANIENHWVWGGGKKDDGEDDGEGEEWVVKRAHWRLRVEPVEGEGKMMVVLCGVRVEGFCVERVRNMQRGFLG